jgi:hypothetical protein
MLGPDGKFPSDESITIHATPSYLVPQFATDCRCPYCYHPNNGLLESTANVPSWGPLASPGMFPSTNELAMRHSGAPPTILN